MMQRHTTAQSPQRAFLSDYESHAAALAEAYTNIYGTYKQEEFNNEGRVFCVTEKKFRFNFRNMELTDVSSTMTLSTGKKVQGLNQGFVQNSRYGFDLLDNSKQKGKKVFSNVTFASGEKAPLLCFLMFPFANFSPLGRSYLDLAENSESRVIAYDDFAWDGKPAKRLELKASYGNPVTRNRDTNRFVYYFRPELRWVCVGSETFDGDKQTERTVHRYGTPVNSWPVPLSYESFGYHIKSEGHLRIRYTITSFVKSPEPFPESEFTLSKWGFPEPENVAPATAAPPLPIDDDVLAPPRAVVYPPRPWWHWAMLAGAVVSFFGIIAWIVRRRSRRVVS